MQSIQTLVNNCCTIYHNNSFGSGFIVDTPDKKNIYVLTCAHFYFIDLNTNNNLFKATFNINDSSVTFQCRIVSMDILNDLLLAVVDTGLDFNKQYANNYINFLKQITPVTLYNDVINLQLDQSIYICGNIKNKNILTLTEGKINDTSYEGSLTNMVNSTNLDYITSNCVITGGMSGGPQYVLYNNNYVLVAMTVRRLDENTDIVVGTKQIFLYNFLIDSFDDNTIYNKSNVKYIYNKAWLGLGPMCEYVNQNSSDEYSSLNNYYKNNGLIVTNIVLGFNVVTNTFVYNSYMLNNQNVIKLYSPFENSKLNEN